jgi:hypothetical protein
MINKILFLNTHFSHLAQLEMINIILKCENKNICKQVYNFCHYPTWFLHVLDVLAPMNYSEMSNGTN